MKIKESKKNLEDFGVNEINKTQIGAIKGGQGASIVEEDAEGF